MKIRNREHTEFEDSYRIALGNLERTRPERSFSVDELTVTSANNRLSTSASVISELADTPVTPYELANTPVTPYELADTSSTPASLVREGLERRRLGGNTLSPSTISGFSELEDTSTSSWRGWS
jgi:hypothetical protein